MRGKSGRVGEKERDKKRQTEINRNKPLPKIEKEICGEKVPLVLHSYGGLVPTNKSQRRRTIQLGQRTDSPDTG